MNGRRTRDRVEFPKLKDRLGEDPARFLDCDLIGNPHAQRMVRDRIAGIDSLEVLSAWRAVEKKLADHHDREPRQGVLDALDERGIWLDEHGDRDERATEIDRDPPLESCAVFLDEDGNERETRGTYQSSSPFDRDLDAYITDSEDPAVATDGGEP
ncbi:hypothetical protein [Halobellus ordinarius]|uniref:hypothetical protein n=1 Tax=Halobellus ordinarius TaxID=3075120 RepID=UPI0028803910|nr:hypothetical protein [Halobellus sp. ZY16]